MRLLVIAPEVPYPPHGGGKSRAYNLLSRIGGQAELSLICFSHSQEEEEAAEGLRPLFPVRTVPYEVPPGYRAMQESAGLPAVYHYLRALLADPLPFLVSYFRSPSMQQAVREGLSGNYDAVYVITSMMAQFLPKPARSRAILDLWNVEALVQQREMEKARGRARIEQAIEFAKMLRYERRQFETFGACIAVSDPEKQAVLKIAPSARVQVVENGVDIDHFHPLDTPIEPNSLTFTGTMKYKPNEEAALYFCSRILPLIRAQEPDVAVRIVGDAPPESIRSLASESVEVTGWVSDTRPYLASAAVVVVPLLSGGGSRLKITEALATGKAVVSTSLGAEGLELEPDRHLLIADTPDDFARAVVGLMSDPYRARELGGEGRRRVLERYSWDRLASRLLASCQELAGQVTWAG